MKFFRGMALAVALLLPMATVGVAHADTTKTSTKTHSVKTHSKSLKKAKSTKSAKSTKKIKTSKKSATAKKAKQAKSVKTANSIKKVKATNKAKSLKVAKSSNPRSALKNGSSQKAAKASAKATKQHGKKHGNRNGHNGRHRNPALDQCVDPSPEPTDVPTDVPTAEPTDEPTAEPTDLPTDEPTVVPYLEPTDQPTPDVTDEPTPDPTMYPIDYVCPTPTDGPTEEPSPEPSVIVDPIVCAVYDAESDEVQTFWHNKMCYPVDPIVETPELATLHSAVQAAHEAHDAAVRAAQESYDATVRAKYDELVAGLGENPTYASLVILKLSLHKAMMESQRDLTATIADADKVEADAIDAALSAYDEQTSSDTALGFRQTYRAAVSQAKADLAVARQAQRTGVLDLTITAFDSLLATITPDMSDADVNSALGAGLDTLNTSIQALQATYQASEDAYTAEINSAQDSFLANSGENALPVGPEPTYQMYGKPDRCDGYPPASPEKPVKNGFRSREGKRHH